MAQIPTVVLPRDLYDELWALVKWQYDAPVSIERCLDDLVEAESSIWDRAGRPDLGMAGFAEIDGELVAEDEDGVVHQVVKEEI